MRIIYLFPFIYLYQEVSSNWVGAFLSLVASGGRYYEGHTITMTRVSIITAEHVVLDIRGEKYEVAIIYMNMSRAEAATIITGRYG